MERGRKVGEPAGSFCQCRLSAAPSGPVFPFYSRRRVVSAALRPPPAALPSPSLPAPLSAHTALCQQCLASRCLPNADPVSLCLAPLARQPTMPRRIVAFLT